MGREGKERDRAHSGGLFRSDRPGRGADRGQPGEPCRDRHDLRPRRAGPQHERRAAQAQRGGPGQPYPGAASADRPGQGGALEPVAGRGLHHAGDHRPQYRWQDRDAQDRGPVVADGPGGHADSRGLRLGAGHLRRNLRRHRRRAKHRAEPVHLLQPHDEHRRHPRSRDREFAGAVRRAGRRHRPHRGRGSGHGDPEPSAGEEGAHNGHHPLQRAEGVRPVHPGRGERLGGVQRGDPAAHLPAVHRRAGQVQRLRNLPEAGSARGDHRQRQGEAQRRPGAL